MRLLKNPLFFIVSLGHLCVDTLNGHTGVLLAFLSTPLGLSNSTIGLIATLYSILGALTQPFFGWLSDRYGGRWTTAGGILWMVIFFSLFAVTPGYWPFVFLVIGALGSAAFHPPGAMRATQISQTLWAGQAATAASIFFLFGQSGWAIGPTLSGFIVDHGGRTGVLLVTALILPVGVTAAYQLRPSNPLAVSTTPKQTAETTPSASGSLGILATIMIVAALQAWGQLTTSTFAPKYFHDLGIPATVYGAIMGCFMGGSAIGGVFGAMIGDRWDKRRTITGTLAISAVMFYFLPLMSGGWLFGVAFVAGLFNGAPFSILVTMAQRALPGRAATASGIILGLMFTAGTIGAYFSGLVADQIGLGVVLQGNALISLVAALASLGLMIPEKKANPAILPLGD